MLSFVLFVDTNLFLGKTTVVAFVSGWCLICVETLLEIDWDFEVILCPVVVIFLVVFVFCCVTFVVSSSSSLKTSLVSSFLIVLFLKWISSQGDFPSIPWKQVVAL